MKFYNSKVKKENKVSDLFYEYKLDVLDQWLLISKSKAKLLEEVC